MAQLDDNLKSMDVTLAADDVKALDEASKLTVEYPAWMERWERSAPRRESVLVSRDADTVLEDEAAAAVARFPSSTTPRSPTTVNSAMRAGRGSARDPPEQHQSNGRQK